MRLKRIPVALLCTTVLMWSCDDGDPPNAFHWGEAVMDFFIAHPKD
jgi:hypothetical protein